MATDTSVETRNLEDKLDALANLVTQLAANQKTASIARVYGIRSSNDNHTSVSLSSQQSGVDEHLEAYLQTPIADHHSSRDKTLDTSAETRKLEGKLDALVNLVTELAGNQKPTFVARVCVIHSFNDHHTSVCPSSQQSGVDDNPDADRSSCVATDKSTKTRKLEGKLDALMNLITQLAANQKSSSVARVCGIRSSNDHHTSVCPSLQQSGVDDHPQAYDANTYSRPPHKRERKTLDREDGSQLLAIQSARNDGFFIRVVHDVATRYIRRN
ncbi:hypothetical protein Fmac_028537 [Flemingia macrophylla]|uniref:Uncharacterized protein n=1 Tax=Flemingia macrophylla TaxID=520843 RepID=A0ABD1L861_9FABA